MFILFDQEYNTELYGKEREIKGAVDMCKDLGLSITETISRIAAKFDFEYDVAKRYVNDFWENKADSNEEEDYGWAL